MTASVGPPYRYIKDPAEIYRESARLIRDAADLSSVPPDLHDVAIRLIHTCGRPDVVTGLRASAGAVDRGRDALLSGKPILCDVEMLSKGIIRRRLPKDNDVMCTLGLGAVAPLAARLGTTRSAAAVDLWQPWLDGSVVAIGNAPTALFHLLERIEEGFPKPALILGFPVGFVGAAESKQALMESGLPYITLTGREGGSALAAAAVNALIGSLET
jgi:precorrin-8X/cobalt-precorrin-8 methylmutase